MAGPEVSVLLPVRDAVRWAESALASLVRQTLCSFEVVVVDDGSRDGSTELLRAWAARCPRVRVIEQPRLGLVAALNEGLGACRAPFVARMDADDICHPRRLELLAHALVDRPDLGVVTSDVTLFPAHRTAEGFRCYVRWLNSLHDHEAIVRERFVESPVAHPAVMVRAELLRGIGGWRDLEWPEDYDLWLRLIEAGVRFGRVSRPLLAWRERPDRLTRTDERYRKRRFLGCKAHFLARGPLRHRRAMIWGAGPTGREIARSLLSEGVALAAFVDIDAKLHGRRIRGAPVLPVEELPPRLADDVVVLAAVAARGARDLIRARLDAFGLVEGVGYWCVA